MSEGYSMMIDTSRCTACRGCQVACKQWNGLPGTKTRQLGTYQNPQDFSAETWKLVRFAEGKGEDGKPYWYFLSDMCRHCFAPGCMADVGKDEIIQDEKTGAVIFTPKTKNISYKATVEGCPFNIPRQDPKTKVMYKCTMCIDRITNNMLPACAQSCPTGSVAFGERAKILKMVEDRVKELKKDYPKAQALNTDDVRVIFIVTDDPKKYHKFAAGK